MNGEEMKWVREGNGGRLVGLIDCAAHTIAAEEPVEGVLVSTGIQWYNLGSGDGSKLLNMSASFVLEMVGLLWCLCVIQRHFSLFEYAKGRLDPKYINGLAETSEPRNELFKNSHPRIRLDRHPTLDMASSIAS